MSKILDMASKQVLGSYLGFEEGNYYFNLLNKIGQDHKYSHSKTYRILRTLLDYGAVVKTRELDKENSILNYEPLPPTFLSGSDKITKELLDYMLKVYDKNFPNFFQGKYLEIIMRWGNSLSLYLVKNYMKEYAIIVGGGCGDYELYKKILSQDQFEKITYICRGDRAKNIKGKIKIADPHLIGSRRCVIIDGKIIMDILRFPKEKAIHDPLKTRFSGYLLSKDLKENNNLNYILETEKEIRKLFKNYL